MSAPTVPISEASYQLLKELAEQTGQPMLDVLDKALDAYRRKLFFEQMNAGYAELRADPEAWAEHLAERKQWDAALMDGLDPDERWTDDGRCVTPEEGKP
jgi:predicted transcriptional regulator